MVIKKIYLLLIPIGFLIYFGGRITANTSYFTNFTVMYKICQTHIDILRNHNDNFVYEGPFISCGAIKEENNSQIELNISTNKYKFKKFEPILILFNYINHGNKNDTVYNAFDELLENMKFTIEGENGKIYNKKNLLADITPVGKYRYVVAPGDTLKVPMSLNSYGEPVKYENEYYFNQWSGYLPVGKYKVTAIFPEYDGPRKFDPPLKSNTIEIEVTELNKDDKILLEIYKKRFNELVSFLGDSAKENNYLNDIGKKVKENFKNSPYKEHMLYEYLQNIRGKYHDDLTKEHLIMDAYSAFLNNFPHSIYTLNDNFIFWYLMKGSFSGRNNVSYLTSRVEEVRQKFPGTPLSRYLLGSVVKEYIERISRYEE